MVAARLICAWGMTPSGTSWWKTSGRALRRWRRRSSATCLTESCDTMCVSIWISRDMATWLVCFGTCGPRDCLKLDFFWSVYNRPGGAEPERSWGSAMFLTTANLATRNAAVCRHLDAVLAPPLRDIVVGYAGDGSMRDFFLTAEILDRDMHAYQGVWHRWRVWSWTDPYGGQANMVVQCSFIDNGVEEWDMGRLIASGERAWDIICIASAFDGHLAKAIERLLDLPDDEAVNQGARDEAGEVAPYMAELMRVRCAHAMAMRELMRRARDV